MAVLKPDEKANILLTGVVGSGKTTSLRSIVEDCGKELFVLATEPGIHTILGDLPEDKCHWNFIPPAKVEWETLIDNAEKINKLQMDALQKLPGLNKTAYNQFIQVLNQLANFKCQRTGEEFGPTDDWGPERVLAIDGLSGLSRMAMDLVIGAKPIKTQPEWGVAQDNLLRLVNKLCDDTKCSFVLIAHLNRKEDKITGGTQLAVSTLGQALPPEIPKPFDEVVMSVRRGKEFKWTTLETNMDLKSRTLPLDDNLAADFSLIFGDAK